MKKDKLTSTIVIGIFLLISLIFVIWLIPFNMKESIEKFNASINDSTSENPGGIIALIFAGSIALFAIMLSGYIPAILCIINSSISLIFSIKNRKSENKVIRIINYVYDGLLSSIIIFAIIKIILFWTNIG